MKTVNLLDVAELEARAQKDRIYPAGSILVQVSATKGDIMYLRQAGKVENKYAVILPKPDYHGFYLFSIFRKFYPLFFEKYRQGLNLVPEDLKHFCFKVHTNEEQRKAITSALCFIGEDSLCYKIPQ